MASPEPRRRRRTSATRKASPTRRPGSARQAARRADIFKALGDPRRVRIVEYLAARGEVSGSEVAAATGMSLALLCHHWNVLQAAGLITRRKAGQRTYCALDRGALRAAVRALVG